MAETMEALGRKLATGEELRSVVGTMKGLAAVSIHEYERSVRSLRSFTRTVELGFQILFERHPEALPREGHARGERPAVVVIGSDQGMCGTLNREIVSHSRRWLSEHGDEWAGEPLICAAGARVVRRWEMAGVSPDELIDLPGSVEGISRTIQDLVLRIDEWQRERGIGRVIVFHQVPQQRTSHRPHTQQVVPLDVSRMRVISRRQWRTNQIPGIPEEAGWREILAGLTREDLRISLFRSFAEARAAEHGARLAAMQSAERNIEERLEELSRRYHRVRQGQITREILDIVAGFEALEGSDRNGPRSAQEAATGA